MEGLLWAMESGKFLDNEKESQAVLLAELLMGVRKAALD